ncbi:ABC transporter permease subunit [Agrobacterium rhizogenes]|uniref:Glutamine ABC transporter permease protein n=1 Tax=Rhizobium rhizogenes NBRC 13257 TaxID=1220581 RepID=A0AA87Q7U6_RHIRH|nr:ABC transporter permease subunit [Rhizobium rhizogenes]NTF65832.1 ABC transporter permease subunit [Rhizobium rhizogenes]NTF97953.1 ABC transporter permease subunit [Rhizobium rhizogenes]NTG25162.1 ABC transporter permease subunit [Rhizobium rhizogenes]NTG38975.1 ABC transporter permease subunit [Rhizobium rhizogenes]NTG58101.1 ABC transporter permease subunit [Rhizobium rhizogenes]
MTFEWSAIIEALPALLRGAAVTIMVAAASLLAGMILGTIIGVVRTYAPKYISLIAQVYIGLIRGTPMVVQIMFIYFALPSLLDIKLTALTAGMIALTVNSSAYLAEIVRGGFLAVPYGLREAGLAMGLPLHRVLLYIIGPVAFRRMVPALGNQFIIGLKDTSLLIVIGVAELTRTGQEIMTENYRAVEIWAAVGAIYLVIISIMAIIFRVIEKRIQMT